MQLGNETHFHHKRSIATTYVNPSCRREENFQPIPYHLLTYASNITQHQTNAPLVSVRYIPVFISNKYVSQCIGDIYYFSSDVKETICFFVAYDKRWEVWCQAVVTKLNL